MMSNVVLVGVCYTIGNTLLILMAVINCSKKRKERKMPESQYERELVVPAAWSFKFAHEPPAENEEDQESLDKTQSINEKSTMRENDKNSKRRSEKTQDDKEKRSKSPRRKSMMKESDKSSKRRSEKTQDDKEKRSKDSRKSGVIESTQRTLSTKSGVKKKGSSDPKSPHKSRTSKKL